MSDSILRQLTQINSIIPSNASCFSLLWLYLGITIGNSQVSVNRTIGPTLVYSIPVDPASVRG